MSWGWTPNNRPGHERPPLRVLIDGRLRVPLDAPFFKAGPALVATCVAVEEQYANGPECLIVPGFDGQVDLRQLLVELAARGVNEVLVEAGPRLAGRLLSKVWSTSS
jgi:diaminohydroxyphosphoribosylaminopyrimidine deaminase/5-amino-6-(5-phosphoribosylamino)uracil reductase